jgi:hypothetical protein
MTINKIKVKGTQRYYGDFEGSPESIIASLQADLDAGWEGIETDYEQLDGLYDFRKVYCLHKHREETDKEYESMFPVEDEE